MKQKQQKAATIHDLAKSGITISNCIVYEVNTKMCIWNIEQFMDCPIDTITTDSTKPGHVAVYVNASDLFETLFETLEELKNNIESD